jgi:chemotaxis protein methyltransferase CheR
MTGKVGDCDVQAFRGLLAQRLGLSLEGVPAAAVASVLTRRVTARGGLCAAYLRELASGPPAAEIGALAAELTVGETYFYRHLEQLRALAEVALPQRLAARADQRRLRILSAGCASGEEAYTIAMVIRETVPDDWDVRILGVDANPAMIHRAGQAGFSRWALRTTPADVQQRWFSVNGATSRLDDAVRRPVRFIAHNLVDDDPRVWPPDSYDVVFCRNVLMYLTPSAAAAVMGRVGRSLASGGFLFLGHAEAIHGRTDWLEVRHSHDAFYFQRASRQAPEAGPPAPAALTAMPTPIPRPVPTLVPTPVRTPVRTPVAATGWELALELLRGERFAAALEVAEALTAGSPHVAAERSLHAILLIHGGHLARGEAVCRQLIEDDPLDSGAHYLLALCREGRGDEAAARHYRTATYLDPGFAVARLRLGLLARQQGDGGAARRELGHALTLLAREDQDRLLLYGGGFSRQALTALCRAELLACGGVP